MKKKFFAILAVVFLSFFMLTACEEEAAVKVKFCDSKLTSENETIALFPGSYDLVELATTGLSEYTPTKEGYKFVKWTLDLQGTQEFSPASFTGTDALLTVYAQWEELRKVVTYNGASVIKTYYYDYLVDGTQTLEDASKNGYTFKGWTTDSSNETPFDLATYEYPTDTKTVRIFANFEIITTVNFYNGNTLVSQLGLSSIKEGTALPQVEKAGYNFEGWYLDEEYTQGFDPANYVGVTSNVKVYAKFTAKPQVFYYDGETLYTSYYLENSATATVANPTKEGYTFVGWVDSQGEPFTLKTASQADQKAYARWEQRTTVLFYSGTEVKETRYLDALTASNIPTVTKDTYTFKGWYTDQTFDTPFDVITYTTSAKLVNLYAKFERNTVIVYMNGTEVVAERTLSALKAGTVTAPTVTKAGYNFDKWTSDESGETSFNYQQFTSEELEVKVYAKWTEKIKVSYMVDGALYEAKYLEEVESTYVPTAPTKEGYNFVGWYVGEEKFVLNISSTSNLVATAKFVAKLTVKFYNGETLLETKYLEDVESSYRPTSPTKAGYRFVGWVDSEGNEFTLNTESKANLVANASFEKITTVVYMNGSSQVAERDMAALVAKTATAPTAPEKEGYEFKEWTTDAEGTIPFVPAISEQDTITVYAQYTALKRVTYYVDSTVYEFKYLNNISSEYVPTAPTKEGYNFVGWYVGEEEFVLNTSSTSNLVATAKFEAKLTVKFYNEETLIETKYLDEVEESYRPSSPTKSGYNFVGWVDVKDAEFTLNTASTTNLVAYAKFVAKLTVKFYNGETLLETKYLDEVEESYRPTSPTKSGYRFVGWVDSEGNEFVLDTTSETNLVANASFEKITTVVYINGSSQVAERDLAALKAGTATAPIITKDGFTFDKWTTDSEGTKAFTYVGLETEEDTITVYAQFTAKPTVNFYSEGKLVETKYLDEVDATYRPSDEPTKAGYNFIGWYDSEDVEFVLDTESESSLNAYAKFVAKLTVKFYNGETLIETKYLDEVDSSYRPSNDPTKEGYNFVGWYDSEDVEFVLDTESETNLVAYAKFVAKLTVKFYNDETLLETKYLDEVEESYRPTSPTKSGYRFVGWVDSEGNEFVLDAESETNLVANASFEKITTVVYMNGSSQVAERDMAALVAKTATAPTAPEKEGYEFKEWTTDAEGTIPFVPAISEQDTITVYAQYTALKKVTYYVDSTVYEFKYLKNISSEYVPTEPTKSGYFFKAWVDAEGETFVLDVDSLTDIEAYATWYKNPEITNLAQETNDDNKTVTVSWQAGVTGTTYKVKVDDGEFEDCASNSYVLSSAAQVGYHTIYVKSIYLEHESEVASINVIQKVNYELTGVSFDKNTRTISWDAVENAEYYMVSFNEAEAVKCTANNFTIADDVKHGNYQISVKPFVTVDSTLIPAFKADSEQVTVESVERLTETGLFINESDQYVLLAGATYSFGDYAFVSGSYYELSNDDKSITIKEDAAGAEFTLTTTTGKAIEVKVENYISFMSSGSNWNNYLARANSSNKNDENTNVTGFINTTNMYEVGTGDTEYIVDLSIEGTGTTDTDYKFDITGKVGDDENIDSYVSLFSDEDGKYHLSWDASAGSLSDGTIVELTIKSHYTSKAQQDGSAPSVTFKFKVNSGVNAYTFTDLRDKVSNGSIKTVNLHQNVTITQAMVEEIYGSDWGKSEATNSKYYSLIKRSTSGYEDFTLNGNYFKIDASNVNRGKYQEHDAGPGYTVYWPMVGIFHFENGGTNETISTDNGTYYVKNNGNVTVSNLEVKGNTILTVSLEAQGDATKLAAELLDHSGAIDAFCIDGYSTHMNNLVVHHVTESVKYGVVSYSDNTDDGVKIRYVKNNTHIIEECAYSDNWANNSYIWSDGYFEYKNSHIYTSSGVGIILGDSGSHALQQVGKEPIEYVDEASGIRLMNYPTIVLNNTEFDNWVLGSEAYYTAYGMATAIAGYKTTMESVVSSSTGGAYTLLQTTDNNYSYVNMCIQVNAEEYLHTYAIGYQNPEMDEPIIKTIRTSYLTDDSQAYPSHPMAGGSVTGQVLLPIGEYSSDYDFGMLYYAIADSTNGEIVKYGQYLGTVFTTYSTVLQNTLTNGGTTQEAQEAASSAAQSAAQTWMTAYASSISNLIYAFGQDELTNAPFLMLAGESNVLSSLGITIDFSGDVASQLGTQLSKMGQPALFRVIFKSIDEARTAEDGTEYPFYIEVTLHSITGYDALTTIVIQGLDSSTGK